MTRGGRAHRHARVRYGSPEPSASLPPAYLLRLDDRTATRFVFFDRIEIGRDTADADLRHGRLLVDDPSVSRCHCLITRSGRGRCFVRDVSRNGTRVDGRRLVPSIDTALRSGQVVAVSHDYAFALIDDEQGDEADTKGMSTMVTTPSPVTTTVLVGDIRDYTGLVRRAPSAVLQESMARLFEALGGLVPDFGGTVKEYQGDALVAFWESQGDDAASAVSACRAALALDAMVQRLAVDRTVWTLEEPLQMHWAIATGEVVIRGVGGKRPIGLSMIGPAVVLAFRLEKFAADARGRILVCHKTATLASSCFRLGDLGEMTAKGFDQPDRVFALEGTR